MVTFFNAGFTFAQAMTISSIRAETVWRLIDVFEIIMSAELQLMPGFVFKPVTVNHVVSVDGDCQFDCPVEFSVL